MSERIRVLVVDDDADVSEVTATYLERANEAISTVTERDAEDGLARLTAEDETVDCVVSDYDMPGTNGLEFLEAVRAVDPDIPFVLFTGKGSEEIASEAISAGVTDYLQKETGTEQYEVLANRVENAVAQHRAEARASEADRQIRRLFRRITDAFFALDDEWRFTYINQQAAEPTGYSPEELVGMRIQEVLPEAEAEEFYRAYRTAFEEQEVVTLETESAIRPGNWVEERVYPSEDGLSVYFRDVTDRKNVEYELQETKRKIEELHDVATRAVSLETSAAVFDLAIEAAEEILDFDICAIDTREGDELVQQATSSSLPPADTYQRTSLDAENNLGVRTYRTGESYLVDDLHAAGVEPATETYRSAISVPVGDVGVFQAASEESVFDEDDLELAELLTAHVAESLKRVRSERGLRTERDRFAALFENVPNPAVNAEFPDEEPVVLDVNNAFEEVFGWSADEIVGESLDEFVVPPGGHEEAVEFNDRALRGERIEGVEVRRETAEGLRDFLLYTVPVGEGDVEEGFSLYTDITEQKQRERALQRQNERLDEFASVISHDLSNPLSVAQGRLALAMDESDSDHLDAVAEAIDRMNALREDVLALARQGQVVSDTETVALASVVEAGWATATPATASLRVEDDLGTVEADPGRLQELFENLFGNAVEHAGPDATVRVGPLDRDDGFYVADDGPGVPPEHREAVFDHGFTTLDHGTGLGLAIVESIAEAHDWSVAATDAASGGARFEFRT